MDNAILHMDLDTFFVSCERLVNPTLLKKPVLVGGTGDRGIVSACSYEARPFGIYSGISMKLARRLCPEAVCIRGNSQIYLEYSNTVTEIIKEEVPSYEKSSVDEFYADLTGMDKYFGTYKFAKELRSKIIHHTGLPISFGLSKNKVVSKVATGEAKPNNQMLIHYGEERSFLAPLAIRKIPLVGKASASVLRDLGIYKVGELQEMPIEVVVSVMGKNGKTIWERANGIDTRPLIPYRERESITSGRTYDRDTIDLQKVKATLMAMGEKVCYQLRMGNKVTSCLYVNLRYADFSNVSKQCRIPYTSADHIIIPKIMELFDKLYDRRVLIRKVGIGVSHLTGGHYQIDLFDDNHQILNLYNSMDHLRNRFGPSAVMRASTMDVKSVRSNRNPFNGEPPVVLAHRKE